jgi:hypothetical protein
MSLENRQTTASDDRQLPPGRHFIFIEPADFDIVPHLKKRKTDLRNMGPESIF